MKRLKGFTLRELVAILCLVGLAVPVAAVSMHGRQDKLHMFLCMSRLRSLTHVIHLYAEQNRGYMPVYRHQQTMGYIDAPYDPWKTAVAFASSPLDPNTGLFRDVRNFGNLYILKYVQRPELFYCPAQPDARYTLENYPKPWGSAVGPGSMLIRVGYMWDPWVKQIPGGSSDEWTFEDGLELRKHPFGRPLICDLVWDINLTGHVMGHSARWNMAYPAGHVVPFTSKKLYEKLESGFGEHMNWEDFNDPNSGIRPLLPGANARWWDWMKWWGRRLRH